MKTKNIAIILAGGTGSRMGGDLPKQFLPIGGRAMIEYPISTFCSHPAIDEVAVVIHPQWRAEMEAIVARNRWGKFSQLIDGGSERYQSSHNAIAAYAGLPPEATNLWLHDAARPMVSAAIISRVAAALATSEAVGVAVPCTDTIWEVESGERETEASVRIASIPDRRRMWRAQTPQAFRLGLITEAYRRAMADPALATTDDCGVVMRYVPEATITVVDGEEQNRKFTFAEDLTMKQTDTHRDKHPES